MPRPNELWKQVEAEGGTAEQMAGRYRALLVEHGHLITDPKCYECSQTSKSKIHNDPNVEGAHEFKPALISEDALLHVAYIEMSAEEARAHWEIARAMPEQFERLIRHAVNYEFTILGGEQARADYAAGKKGGYAFEIVNKTTGERSTGMACSGYHPGERLKRCEFCRSRAGIDECDFVVGEKCRSCKGTKYKGLKPCPRCAGRGVHISKDESYCPAHARELGLMPKPKLKREQCRWVGRAQAEGSCLHQGCGNVVKEGARCLYFPFRRRAMCVACGEAYLKASE